MIEESNSISVPTDLVLKQTSIQRNEALDKVALLSAYVENLSEKIVELQNKLDDLIAKQS